MAAGNTPGETGGDIENDSIFANSSAAYFSGSGDNSMPGIYPPYSPNVLAVGATNLNVNPDNSYLGEKGWSSPAIVTGATEAGNTVTITTANATGFSAGNDVYLLGIGAGYDGYYTIQTAPSDTSFTYTSATAGLSAVNPATATITAATEAGTTVTITTAAANGVAVNDIVEISGVAVAGYNGRFTVTSVLSPTKFTFNNSSTGLAASSGGTAVHALGFGAGGGSVFDDGNAGGTGGGISQYETPQPVYQQGTVTKVTQSTTYRTIPDVSFVGGSATPVYEYDSAFGAVAPEPTGGTSLSSPCWAGLVAIADQGLALRGLPPLNTDTGAGATLQTALYDSPLTDFHDITSGYNGFNAGPGLRPRHRDWHARRELAHSRPGGDQHRLHGPVHGQSASARAGEGQHQRGIVRQRRFGRLGAAGHALRCEHHRSQQLE